MRCIPHKLLAADHILDEAWLDMRDNRSEKVWVEGPKSASEKSLDLVGIKGIYRAGLLAES